MKKLYIITRSYPYGTSETFLGTEINYLSKVFPEIVIWPLVTSGDLRQIPSNVSVSSILSEEFVSHKINKLSVLTSFMFLRNIRFNTNYIKRLYTDVTYVKVYDHLFTKLSDNIDFANSLFYTYWFASDTVALTSLMNSYNINLVSRTHGSDLYESVSRFRYFPFRQKVLNSIHRVFTISADGINHLNSKYTFPSHKVQLSRLGTLKSTSNSIKSNEYDLNIISCAFLTKVKRIDLLLAAVCSIDNLNIKWIHIGGGPLELDLKNKAENCLRDNIDIEFLGNMKNADILKHYQNNYYDAFINVSSSEGIPVSIMEAMSFSIPTIATDVGGVHEIVNDEVGILLDANPTVEDIRNAIISANSDAWSDKRNASFSHWNKNYNAEKNYTLFAEKLLEIAGGESSISLKN